MTSLPERSPHVYCCQRQLFGLLMGLVALSWALWACETFAEPYDHLSAHTPALWDADGGIWYPSTGEWYTQSLYLIGLSGGGAEDYNPAFLLAGGFPFLDFRAKVWAAGAIGCPGEASPSAASMRLGATFDLYRSLHEDKLGATIIIKSTPEAPATHATGWVFRCLDSQSCDLGVEHVGEVDLGPVPWDTWIRWLMFWDEPNGLFYFGRLDATPMFGVVAVPDPVKTPLTTRSFEAWAVSSACPESYGVGMIEIGVVEILR